MARIVDYAAYVIDLTDAMMSHRVGLTDDQLDHLETINRRAVQFVTDFLLHENGSLDQYLSYLNHDAMSPLSVIIGYSEFMLMGGSGDMQSEYREAVEEIRNCGYYLRDEVTRTREKVLRFMKRTGVKHRPRNRPTGSLPDTGTFAS